MPLVRGRHKLVQYLGCQGYEGKHQLYDLAKGPEGLEDLASAETEMAVELQNELETRLKAVGQPIRAD